MHEFGNLKVRLSFIKLATITIVMMVTTAEARLLNEGPAHTSGVIDRPESTPLEVAQRGGGMSLSEAVAQVRRQTKGQILSAETKVSGNREVHHIRVLTKDGKVKTHKVPGRTRNGR